MNWQQRLMKSLSRLFKNKTYRQIVVNLNWLSAFSGILLLFLLACTRGEKQDESDQAEVINVTIKQVTQRNVKNVFHTTGILSLKSEAKLSFKTGGILKSIFVEEGDFVKEGQVLAQLNLAEIGATVNQANLALIKANRDAERIENLYKDSVATLEQLQNIATAQEFAKASVQVGEFNLQYSTIKAPSNGKILKRLYEANEMVAPGYPVFLFGSAAKDWVIRANVTDKQIISVQPDDSAMVFFDAYPVDTFYAFVSEVGRFADPYTGTFEIELKMVNQGRELVSGFIGRVSVISTHANCYLSVPVDALVEGTGTQGVVYEFLNRKAVKKTVEIVKIIGSDLIIASGLSDSALIIVEGAGYIRPESEIVVVNQ